MSNCLTERFVEEPVYDDSGTDLLYFKYRITVICYVHGDGTGLGQPADWIAAPFPVVGSSPAIANGHGQTDAGPHAPVPDATNAFGNSVIPGAPHDPDGAQLAVLNYRTLRIQLTEPRGRFQMWIGDNQILRSVSALHGGDGFGGFVLGDHDAVRGVNDKIGSHDLNNGPKILECEIDKVQGPHIFRIRWSVEVCLQHCDDNLLGPNTAEDTDGGAGIGGFGGPKRSHVLSNRWTVEDVVDDVLETTRTYRGVLRTTTAMINPNQFRSYCLPPLSMGMRRESMSFATSADSLTLSYTIIDREVAYAAPFPALDWDFQWGLSAGDGKIGVAEGSVRLRGHRNTKKGHLMQLGLEILESRLKWKSDNEEGKRRNFIENITIQDFYGSRTNEVRVSARVRLVGEAPDEMDDGPLPLPFRQALPLLGMPIDMIDVNDHSENYDRNWSPQGAQHVEMPSPLVQGSLPLAQAFSCALQEVCSDAPLNLGQKAARPDLPQHPQSQDSPDGMDISFISPGEDEIKTKPSRFSGEHHKAPYVDFHASAEFSIPEMTVATPIAGPAAQPTYSAGSAPLYSFDEGSTTVPVSLTKPQCKYVVTIMAERIGQSPVLPEMKKTFTDHNDIVYTLNSVNPIFVPPQLGKNGEERHAMNVRYDYIMNRPPVLPGSGSGGNESLVLPEIPWLTGGNNTIASSANAGRRITSEDVFRSDFTTE